jgi:predicted DNA-binding transcriptional regulator AlpA
MRRTGYFCARSTHPKNRITSVTNKTKRSPTGNRTNVYIERAAALKAANVPGVRLLDKPTVLAIANCSYPSLWAWMRNGKFPRGRIVGGRSMWLSTEIEDWLNELPVRRLKGDAPSEAALFAPR